MLLMQLIPSIIQIVREIEKAIPQKGQGSAKLALVLDTVNVAAHASTETVKAIEGRDLNGAVTNIVGAVVSTLNAVGAFNKPDAVGP